VNLGIATHQTGSYIVATPVYEGPLDLLLQLIERAELDITRLALALVTDQYLLHLKQMQERPAEEVSAFLVIAARLLQIKSEALLPRPVIREVGEEDPGEALARQLSEYKKFRRVAGWLSQKEALGRQTYLRLAGPVKVEAVLDLSGITLPDLVSFAQEMLLRQENRQPLSVVVAPPRVTIREKIALIASALKKQGRATFRSLLGRRLSRIEIVVTFLALLELVKRRLVVARQPDIFGEIEIEMQEKWDEGQDFDLEFGE
jgi:segregation and condensation protein A